MTGVKVVFLGPPGAGKTTQAARLSREYSFKHVETGRSLRSNKEMRTKYGTAAEYIDDGELVPHPIVNELIRERITEHDQFVFDGYPRTESQVKFLDRCCSIDRVIHLNVPKWVAKERLVNRVICENCGSPYNKKLIPPTNEGVCDSCSGQLVQRPDDEAGAVENRIQIYLEETCPLLDLYGGREILVEINARKSIGAVWAEIELIVQSLLEARG